MEEAVHWRTASKRGTRDDVREKPNQKALGEMLTLSRLPALPRTDEHRVNTGASVSLVL